MARVGAEAGLLLLERGLEQRLGAGQLGERLAHFGDQLRHQPVHQGVLGAEQMGMAHGAAHDPAKDVAAALIGREDSVGDQEAGRANVVGDDPVRGLAVALGAGAGQLLGGVDQRLEGVGVVIVVDALHHRRDALEPHAGVDAFLGSSATISSLACSYCMNTRFQISTKRSPSSSGEPGGPPARWSPWS